MADTKKMPSALCKDCMNWEAFGDACWFYWEEKKECANHSEGFKSVKEHFELDASNYHPLL